MPELTPELSPRVVANLSALAVACLTVWQRIVAPGCVVGWRTSEMLRAVWSEN